MLVIEKDKELPKERIRNNYPYKIMEVGDSFYAAGSDLQVVCNANYRAQKKLDKKFIARKEGEGIRVWRTR
jgi:hypothetical protein